MQTGADWCRLVQTLADSRMRRAHEESPLLLRWRGQLARSPGKVRWKGQGKMQLAPGLADALQYPPERRDMRSACTKVQLAVRWKRIRSAKASNTVRATRKGRVQMCSTTGGTSRCHVCHLGGQRGTGSGRLGS